MVKKTLGFLGKGGVVRHFFRHIQARSDYLEFLQEVKTLVFLQKGYENNEHYRRSPAFKDIQESIQKNKLDMHLEIVDSWKVLLSSCDMVIDATQSPPPYSLKELGQSLWKNRFGLCKNGDRIDPNLKDDFRRYQELEERKKEEGDLGRLRTNYEDYERRWNASKRYLEKIISVHKVFPLGCRSLNFLPFNIDMVIERAEAIKSAMSGTGLRLPIYLNIINEPCVTANIMASIYPEMTLKIVACTNYDLMRLENKLNDYLLGAKKKAGLEDYTVKFSSFGFHDDKVIVPEIWPRKQEDYLNFERLFSQIEDYQQAYNHLLSELTRYIESSGQVDGINNSESTDIRHEVDEGMMQVIISGLKSIGRPISVYPPVEKASLYNGCFMPLYEDNRGFFMIGAHRFRNGKIIREESGVRL